MAVMPRATSREEYEKWFKEADKDNNGVLTSKEVKKMFKSKGYKTKSKVFKEQFSQLDADGDAKVTLAEYLQAMGEIPQDKHRSLQEADDHSSDSYDSSSDDEVTVHVSENAPSREIYEKWFKEADKNNDGTLSSKELKAMFKKRGYKMSSKGFKSQFATLDTDGDKKVSLQEYLMCMGEIPDLEHKEAEIRAKFLEADKNGDGVLDLDEMKAALREIHDDLTGKQLFDLMHKADKDGSGMIDYNEFLVLWLKEQGVLQD